MKISPYYRKQIVPNYPSMYHQVKEQIEKYCKDFNKEYDEVIMDLGHECGLESKMTSRDKNYLDTAYRYDKLWTFQALIHRWELRW